MPKLDKPDETDKALQAREPLRRNEERLRALIQGSNDAIVTKTLDGIVTSWNPGAERIFGYGAQEMIGRSIMLLTPPARQIEEQYLVAAVRRGEQVEHYESQRLTKDHRLIDVSITASPIHDAAGRVVGVSKIARDITERKRIAEELRLATEQLAHANEELERKVRERSAKLKETLDDLEHFSHAIMHDMRAPLRAMCGFSSILLKECPALLEPRHRDLLGRIARSAERMDHLILDALDYSKILRDTLPLSPVDIGALLRGSIESYPGLQPPQAEIRIEGAIPPVLGNQAALSQCCSHLLDNAVKFAKPGIPPQVRVWAETRHETVRLWVEDNGVGIPRDWHDRVFEMFQRLDRAGQGTGIGLALVRKAVRRMGGNVGVESEPGNGSRFWVELKEAAAAEPSL